jgi:hypothetical protein
MDLGPVAYESAADFPNVNCLRITLRFDVFPTDARDALRQVPFHIEHGSEQIYWILYLFTRSETGRGVLRAYQLVPPEFGVVG